MSNQSLLPINSLLKVKGNPALPQRSLIYLLSKEQPLNISSKGPQRQNEPPTVILLQFIHGRERSNRVINTAEAKWRDYSSGQRYFSAVANRALHHPTNKEASVCCCLQSFYLKLKQWGKRERNTSCSLFMSLQLFIRCS